MKTTEIIKAEAKWGREAYIKFVDDKVVFDCSWEEYGPIEFPIELIESALAKHRKKIDHENWLERIKRFTK